MDVQKNSWDKVGRGGFITRFDMMSRVRNYEAGDNTYMWKFNEFHNR